MKTHIGSIHRKGRRYYLVVSQSGKQRWIALQTSTKSIARARASLLAPADSDNEARWLMQLVHIGKTASAELHRRQLAKRISWNSLWRDFENNSLSCIPSASRLSYQRWLRLLADAVAELRLKIPTPVQLSHNTACQIAALLGGRYISANRMFMFYHRVWRTLSLDVEVWKDVRMQCTRCNGKQREYYRRLTVDEVRKVLAFLVTTEQQDYADMVVIGFYTGLRLSDVAELEAAEVSPDCTFLRIQPNKVRNSKAHILTIPLA